MKVNYNISYMKDFILGFVVDEKMIKSIFWISMNFGLRIQVNCLSPVFEIEPTNLFYVC